MQEPLDRELRRLRIEKWRIIYAIDKMIFVLGVKKRPPYNYDDLNELLEEMD